MAFKVNLQNSHYNPETGRFINEEPLGIDGPNLYWYALNNPINYVDRNGLWAGPSRPGAEEIATANFIFLINFIELNFRNVVKADKFFHCMANCEAAKLGPYGKKRAKELSDAREDLQDFLAGGQCPARIKDRKEDQKANRQGRETRPNESCLKTCKSFVVRGL